MLWTNRTAYKLKILPFFFSFSTLTLNETTNAYRLLCRRLVCIDQICNLNVPFLFCAVKTLIAEDGWLVVDGIGKGKNVLGENSRDVIIWGKIIVLYGYFMRVKWLQIYSVGNYTHFMDRHIKEICCVVV